MNNGLIIMTMYLLFFGKQTSSYNMSTHIASRNYNLNTSADEKQGFDAFIQAACDDDHARLQQLLDAGVPVDGSDFGDWTALIHASIHGNSKCLQILINNGADVNEKNVWSNTGLHWTVQIGHINCARMLIENGARIEERDKWGRTPLIIAADSGDNKSVSCIRLLLDNNADVFAKANNGMTAFDHAKKRGNGEIVKMLEEYIAGFNANKNKPESHPTQSAKAMDDKKYSNEKNKQNRCTKCSCKECIQKENAIQNKQMESEEKIKRIEEEVAELRIQQNHPCNISVFVASATTSMFGQGNSILNN